MKNDGAKRPGWSFGPRRIPNSAALALDLDQLNFSSLTAGCPLLRRGIAWRSPMIEQRNRVVQVSRFGDPETLEVVDTRLPTAGRGEVRVRVLASSLSYTEVLIRRHLYPQTMRLRPPFVMGYDVVGAIDQLG